MIWILLTLKLNLKNKLPLLNKNSFSFFIYNEKEFFIMKKLLTFDKFLFEMAGKKDFMGVYKKRYDPSVSGYGNPDKWREAFDIRMDRETAKTILGVRSPYDILGVPETANAYEIKSAYRKMAMKFHPDKNPDTDTTKIFQDISAAYEMLRED